MKVVEWFVGVSIGIAFMLNTLSIFILFASGSDEYFYLLPHLSFCANIFYFLGIIGLISIMDKQEKEIKKLRRGKK